MPISDATKSRRTMVRNLKRKYGVRRVRELLRRFSEPNAGQLIADEFGVSRERVRQWRNMLGRTITVFQPYGEVEAELEDKKPRKSALDWSEDVAG